MLGPTFFPVEKRAGYSAFALVSSLVSLLIPQDLRDGRSHAHGHVWRVLQQKTNKII